MKVRVRLFGILKRYVSDYDPEHGLEIEIVDNANISYYSVNVKLKMTGVWQLGDIKQLMNGQ